MVSRGIDEWRTEYPPSTNASDFRSRGLARDASKAYDLMDKGNAGGGVREANVQTVPRRDVICMCHKSGRRDRQGFSSMLRVIEPLSNVYRLLL